MADQNGARRPSVVHCMSERKPFGIEPKDDYVAGVGGLKIIAAICWTGE